MSLTKKRNVIILTPIPSGLVQFFLEGKEEFSGMPAFKEVFIKLLNDERLEKMYLFLFVSDAQKNKIKVPEKYKDRIVLSQHVYDRSQPFRSVFNIFWIVFKALGLILTKKIHKIGSYRPEGMVPAGILGMLTGKYNSRRVYGTFLINEIEDPNWKIFLRHPLEYLSFTIPGGNLFITNDGTKGDVVFKKIGNRFVKLNFLLNGINKKIAEETSPPEFELPKKFMSYVARIVDWKRQHFLVEALGILKRRGVTFPHSYIIGQVSNTEYLEKLNKTIRDNGLEAEVTVIPGLPHRQSNYMLKHAILTFSLYHTSNLGNVFLESVTLGTPMIAINDTGSLDVFPEDIYVKVNNSDTQEVADRIEEYLKDEEKRKQKSKIAFEYAEKNFKSWPERAAVEVDALLS